MATAEHRVRIGGLMRCCTQTLAEYVREHPHSVPEDGEILPCKWCKKSRMRYRDGAWEWDRDFASSSHNSIQDSDA